PGAATAPAWVKQLALGADQFVARRPLADEPAGMTVIAGYHWFGDWGRDTMISLPGLALSTGRPELAARVLRTFARFVDQGMLPNRLPREAETPEYNTVDATLWWFEAVRATHAATGDDGMLKDLFPILENVVEWHRRGTRYGIGVDPVDGLLHAGEPGVQLTWMDAKVGDWVVTPRTGKPVEIQALWYNALCTMEQFAKRFGDNERADHYGQLATFALASFNHQFWNEQEQCLYDVVENGVGDSSLRPNQVLATSLKYSMLSPERARAVLAKVESELLTPLGLRTLSQSDSRYVGRYEGDP